FQIRSFPALPPGLSTLPLPPGVSWRVELFCWNCSIIRETVRTPSVILREPTADFIFYPPDLLSCTTFFHALLSHTNPNAPFAYATRIGRTCAFNALPMS